MDILKDLITLASIIAAILAWIAKLKWSKEYRQATDRIIEAKDAEIRVLQKQLEHLDRLNPKELGEWLEGAYRLMTNYTNQLKNQLGSASTRITELESAGRVKEEQLMKAKAAFNELSKQYEIIHAAINQNKLPDFITMVASGTASVALSGVTATEPASINPILKELWAVGVNPKDIKLIDEAKQKRTEKKG